MRASDRAYEILRQEIMDGSLIPGQELAEVEQAERIGVSRTPIREALSRLLAEGLTEPSLGRGVIVAPVSMTKVYSLFELRTSLDCTAASLAAQRANQEIFYGLADEFAQAAQRLEREKEKDLSWYYELVKTLDSEIDKAAANRYLSQAQNMLKGQLTRIRKLSKTNPTRLVEAAKEHQQIALAIASGQPQLAEAATKLHLFKALSAIEQASKKEDHVLFHKVA